MQIERVEEPIIAVRRSQYPEDKKPEFLLVGRSNVGKSSFINTLIERKNFARTSSKPGKTQTLNFYLVNNTFYLVDVPGYEGVLIHPFNRVEETLGCIGPCTSVFNGVGKDSVKAFKAIMTELIKAKNNNEPITLTIK